MKLSELDTMFSLPTLKSLCKKNGIQVVKVFGSVVRDEADSQSDVDLLVSFARPTSLLDLVRIERELGIELGCRIDLVTEGALSPYIRETVLSSAHGVYEAA